MTQRETQLKKYLKRIVALSVAGIICIGTIFSVRALSKKVCVNVDGTTLYTLSLSSEINKILDSVGIELHDGDTVQNNEVDSNTLVLDVKRAFDIIIKENGQKETKIKIAEGKVRDALKLANKELKDNFVTNYDLDTELYPNMEIEICRCIQISVNADGQNGSCFAPFGTVEKALGFLQIPLSADDIINVDINSNIYENMEIKINRVLYRETTKIEEIPFEKKTTKTALLKSGQQQVLKEGKKGKKEITAKEMLIDGKVEKSEVIKTNITLQPVTEEILVSSNINSNNNNTTENTLNPKDKENNSLNGYKKIATGDVTAYEPTGKRTATGTIPTEGRTIAVNFKNVPRGSKVILKFPNGDIIEGVGEDTGGFVKHGRTVADVFMSTISKSRAFGRKRNVELYAKI